MKLVNVYHQHRLELIAFLTGASVMVLEIVGARLIAPQFGTSTYVWTAMIGVILAALAVGFTLGGKFADRFHSDRFLASVLLTAALLVLLTGLFQRSLLLTIGGWQLDLRIGALLAALLLFAPPSLCIGMVSPQLAKMRITSLELTGKYIGRLEAAGALGSITGTFLCGYFLLGAFGSRSIVLGIVVVLVLTSLVADPKVFLRARLSVLLITALFVPVINFNPPSVLADVDSSYARYSVETGYYLGQRVRMLKTDAGGIQSAVVLGNPDALALTYVQQFYAAAAAYKAPQRVLVIGGGAYSLPGALVKAYPTIQVDVAEIDSKLDSLARQYFYYQDSPRVHIQYADGRTYLQSATQKYDLIYMDAFSSQSPPFQLTTSETSQLIAQRLLPQGAVIVNLISNYRDGTDAYLRAMLATYQTQFSQVAIYQTAPGAGLDQPQNFQLIASNNKTTFDSQSRSMNSLPLTFKPGGLVLTDDYAPIERLTYY